MPNYLTKEEIRQWRSSLEKITLEEFAARLGKEVEESKPTKTVTVEKPSFEIKTKEFTTEEINFWDNYGITSETLKKYNVKSLEFYSSVTKLGKPYEAKSSTDKFIFAY